MQFIMSLSSTMVICDVSYFVKLGAHQTTSFYGSFSCKGVVNKDPTVWLDGATLTLISFIGAALGPTILKVKNSIEIVPQNNL
jgi:hypothetical protein